jgi:hypothetical protein
MLTGYHKNVIIMNAHSKLIVRGKYDENDERVRISHLLDDGVLLIGGMLQERHSEHSERTISRSADQARGQRSKAYIF